MKIYISGPITGTEDYMERFARAEELLHAEGHAAVNPAKVGAQLPEETTHGEYMKLSIAMLGMCEAAFVMEGWERSKGCREEIRHALRNGIRVVFERGTA